jgi:uncharacterized protein YecA (UPF0149 family)
MSFDSLQASIKDANRKVEAAYAEQLARLSTDLETYRKLHQEADIDNRAKAEEITKLTLANADLANQVHQLSKPKKVTPSAQT